MKKIIVILCIFLTGCSFSEWEYVVNSDYMIFNTSAHEVTFTDSIKCFGDVDNTITAFKHNERYLILNMFDRDTNEFYYYILDMNEEKMSKQYMSIKEYEEDYNFLDKSNFTEWKTTSSAPDGSEYCIEKY